MRHGFPASAGSDGATFGYRQALGHGTAENHLPSVFSANHSIALLMMASVSFVASLASLSQVKSHGFQAPRPCPRIGLDESLQIETQLETGTTPG